ncbi:MAG: hypothetical protein SVR08_15630 [Spirochaetota bacterium]|nr:hypothetical protein [Spirochaetota bacterium]
MKNRFCILIFFILFFYAVPIYQTSTSVSKDEKLYNLTILQEAECKKMHQNIKKYFDIIEFVSNRATGGMLYAGEEVIRDNAKADNRSDDSAQEETDRRGVLVKVMIISLIVWFGLAFYIHRLNRKVTKLEDMLNEL